MGAFIDVEYTLPQAIQSIQGSWISSTSSAAAVSALIAATDAQLLGFFKSSVNASDASDPFNANPIAYNTMLGFCYAGLFLTISATISQLIMTEIFGELPLNAARKVTSEEKERMPKEGTVQGNLHDILVRYGAATGVRWVSWHWFISLVLGIILSVLSVLIYVLVEEPMPTKVLMILLVFYSLFPFLHYLPAPCFSCCGPRTRSKIPDPKSVSQV